MAQVFELFPTPVMRIERVIDTALIALLRAQLGSDTELPNQRSDALSHSRMLTPQDAPLLLDVARRVDAPLREFGTLLFGEELQWRIKEMWVNVMQGGGHQAVHNHANCFVSGILYLGDCDASNNTVFIRSLGGRDYVFSNANPRSATGPFNAERWIGPPPAAGDLLLFPSYLLHEVPVNRGATRVTLAFNAIPDRLDSWGYATSFSA
jgi:uncharacterized protein (TIGR02466 family)